MNIFKNNNNINALSLVISFTNTLCQDNIVTMKDCLDVNALLFYLSSHLMGGQILNLKFWQDTNKSSTNFINTTLR